MLEGKAVVVTGGTGSLGRQVVKRLLSGEMGALRKLTVFSRDEAKQHEMRLAYLDRSVATDDIIYENGRRLLTFRVGDIRDYASVVRVVHDADVIVNAAALKQVPTCEYAPFEAVLTNILGAENIVRAISEGQSPCSLVIGISTDKACKPINVMGMTKALQERVFIEANLECPATRFICVRYGNVIASRGSVVPLFVEQIRRGGPLTITTRDMTRFLLTLDEAVDTIFAAMRDGRPGETFVPKVKAARVVDVAHALAGSSGVPIVFTGIRPGEKIHETLVSLEEGYRTHDRGGFLVIAPMLPELEPQSGASALQGEYCSADVTLGQVDLSRMMRPYIGSDWSGGRDA